MHELPFQVDQLAEARSFQVGFRGAWFRCKIRRIREKIGELFYLLEYVDYPDQRLEWIKAYQKPLHQRRKNKSKSIKGKLMLRPRYPDVCEKPDMSIIFGPVVIVNNTWRVGDLVDWWVDGCYWSGRVAKILEDGRLKIDLLPPPMGEGLTYEAFEKDIRPSLDWCPKNGWTVPIPKMRNREDQHPCAQLIKPEHSVKASNTIAETGIKGEPVKASNTIAETDMKGEAAVQTRSTSLQRSPTSSSPSPEPLDSLEAPVNVNSTAKPGEASNTIAETGMEREAVVKISIITSLQRSSTSSPSAEPLDSLEGPITVNNTAEAGMALDVADTRFRESNSSDIAATSHIRAKPAEILRKRDMNGGLFNKKPSKKARKDRNIWLDSMFLHRIEDTILDLEELVNRIKWIKGLLEFGMPLSSTNQSFWEFRSHEEQ